MAFVAISLLFAGAGCKPAKPAPKGGAAPAQPPKQSSVKEEVGGVVDYAIGAKQLETKKKMENKINQINGDYQRRQQEALDEMDN